MDQSQILISTESKLFREDKGKIYIGNEEIKPEVLDILREQARYLKTSQLYEVFHATIINEAANLALIQSQDFEHVQFAKALYHWQFVLDNLIKKLTEIK